MHQGKHQETSLQRQQYFDHGFLEPPLLPTLLLSNSSCKCGQMPIVISRIIPFVHFKDRINPNQRRTNFLRAHSHPWFLPASSHGGRLITNPEPTGNSGAQPTRPNPFGALFTSMCASSSHHLCVVFRTSPRRHENCIHNISYPPRYKFFAGTSIQSIRTTQTHFRFLPHSIFSFFLDVHILYPYKLF